ncbi:hypothetical protein J5N97_003969 [Dioscorea zingiberensis]|uniref:Peptidyl-prolyl cis-trans isomerase n=1 Tax=Dioscorea zingiberensis TaxID=325984 RepID=A0A9D5D7K0_9LILI|nr:hypothetical protein J5N97_003969 [Dioscorea zingiberensis]
MTNLRVFFDIVIGKSRARWIIMELFRDVVPKTTENFRCMCTGGKGIRISRKALHYKFMCQGKDFTRGNWTGGESIYRVRFKGEIFKKKHTGSGVFLMASAGLNTNGFQFFICTTKTVVEGYAIMEGMEKEGSESGAMKTKVVIEDCGEITTEN